MATAILAGRTLRTRATLFARCTNLGRAAIVTRGAVFARTAIVAETTLRTRRLLLSRSTLGAIPARTAVVARRARRAVAVDHRCIPALGQDHGLTAQLDLAEVVDADDLDLQRVADADDVGDRLDEAIRQLRHVHKTLLARQDLDERTELLDGRHATFVDLANANFGRHRLDVLDAGHDLLGVDAGHRAEAAVLDADAHLEQLLHAADVLASRANDHADLLLRHGHRLKARRIRAQLRARLAQRLQHLAQDVQAALARLLERLLQDLAG